MEEIGFTVLLWNVALTPQLSCKDPTRHAKARVDRIAEILNQYDVVILNECFLFRDKLLKQCLHEHMTTDKKVWYKPFNSGVVILSRFPILDSDYMHYSSGSGWDWFTSKGVVYAALLVGTEVYKIFGSHMQAGDVDLIGDVRYRQAKEVSAYVYRKAGPTDRIIMCGDWNCGPWVGGSWSPHYTSERDAKARNKEFRQLVEGTSKKLKVTLGRVLPEDNPFERDISSFIVSPAVICRRESLKDINKTFLLSDTTPLLIRVMTQQFVMY